MVLDGTPLQLVSEEYGDSMTKTAGSSSAKRAVKRVRRGKPSAGVARRRNVQLSVVAYDGSLRVSKPVGRHDDAVTATGQAVSPIRILIVDGGASDRQACCNVLQRQAAFPVEVVEAETGQDALQMLLCQAFDCILLSNRLPDMSDAVFLSQLDGAAARLPVLNMVDGNRRLPFAHEVESGTSECLVKDAEGHYLALLPAIVKRMLDNHHNRMGKRQAEAMYRTLVEHIQAITYIVSPHQGNQITYVSPQIGQLGITPEMWMKHPGQRFQYVHEADRDAVERAFRRTCLTGEAFCEDYRLCCTNGTVRWFHDAASLVMDGNGHPMFLQGVMMDITHIKEMEAELEDHRRYMDRRIAQRTEKIERRLAVMESCNAALCAQLEQLRNANAALGAQPTGKRRVLKPFAGRVASSRISMTGEPVFV